MLLGIPIGIENKRGPKTEPWGTPVKRGMTSEEEFQILKFCVRLVGYEKIQERANPLTPKLD